MPPRKVILFAGPPPASAVTGESCTLQTLLEPFRLLYGFPCAPRPGLKPSSLQIAWRAIPLARLPLQASCNRTHMVDDGGEGITSWGRPEFFTAARVLAPDESMATTEWSLDDEDAQATLSEFCEVSFAAHESFSTSILESFETSISGMGDGDASFQSNAPSGAVGISLSAGAHLSDLEDVPSAPRVLALQPQTVTLNLIVGIISIAQPRSITTRWGKTVYLVELLVGDDTASGFGITFWLSSASDDVRDPDDDQRGCPVRNLRRQDVVLLQNVALHVFRGKVYGQSLRRTITKVDLLWRADGSGCYSSRALGPRRTASRHPQQDKARLVKDWVLAFVGRDPSRDSATNTTTSRRAPKSWDVPPADTQ